MWRASESFVATLSAYAVAPNSAPSDPLGGGGASASGTVIRITIRQIVE